MLEETATLGNAPPPRTLVVPTDVADPGSIAALFETVKQTYGRIDLLFNNAGISTRGIPFEELTWEQWLNVVAVNLTGSFLCAQHAFRMMKEQQPQGGAHHQQRLGLGAGVFIPSRARGADASARCALCGLQLAHLDPPSSWANFHYFGK